MSCNEKFWVEQVTLPHPPPGEGQGVGKDKGGGGSTHPPTHTHTHTKSVQHPWEGHSMRLWEDRKDTFKSQSGSAAGHSILELQVLRPVCAGEGGVGSTSVPSTNGPPEKFGSLLEAVGGGATSFSVWCKGGKQQTQTQ